ncbi:MAG TPA: hypothetical protein VHV26_07540 [Rhizomicrobium sp.]|jgi:hypothetical protein|nr:hypothetical protein [Rhizomicrobium sp.]
MTAEPWYRTNGRIMRPLAAGVLAAVIIALTALTGIQRGMDHMVSWAPNSEQRAMSIAISESYYGVHLGYIGLKSVEDKLIEVWNRGVTNPGDPALIQHGNDGALINEALQAAASLGPQHIGYLSNRDLTTTWYDDMGEVDFYRLAFRLFGLQIQSYYYLFFAILAISALVFIVTFHDNVYALITLLCTLFAFYTTLHLGLFNTDAPTFPGMRHSSSLALIPMWYFIFLLGRRPSLGRVAGAVIEALIMVFAWRVRGSVSWMFMFVLAAAFVTALGYWLRQARGERSWWGLARATAQWPVLVVALGIAADAVYVQAELHAIYFTDDVLPYHGAWQAAYTGLAYVPEIYPRRVQEAIDKYIGGDAVGSDAVGMFGEMDYLDRTHFIQWDGTNISPPARVSVWTGQMKPRFHDHIIERATLEAVEHHPIYALEIYFYMKPLAIFTTLESAVISIPDSNWLWCILAGGVGGALLFLIFDVKFEVRKWAEPLAMTGAAAVVGLIPMLWAYAAHYTIFDVSLVMVAFAQLALAFALLAPLRSVLNWGSLRPSRTYSPS